MLWEDRNTVYLFSLVCSTSFVCFLVLGNWYRQGEERKRGSFFSALKAPAVVLAHVLCIFTLTCSVLEGGNVDMISLSMFWFSVHSSNSYWGKKKWWETGIHCGSELIMESFLLSIFCNPIRKHFLFKLPHSFYFSCWIYNVPKWFANLLLFWEGLTPCHHYLWNWAFTESKDFHWNLCIKEAEDWLLHIISLKLKIKNRKMSIRVNFLSHSLFAIGGFFSPRKRRLGGEQNVLSGRHIFVWGLFFFFFPITACFICLTYFKRRLLMQRMWFTLV